MPIQSPLITLEKCINCEHALQGYQAMPRAKCLQTNSPTPTPTPSQTAVRVAHLCCMPCAVQSFYFCCGKSSARLHSVCFSKSKGVLLTTCRSSVRRHC